ncbi:MAG: restriction endonuclease subunit R [Chloroflexota bacterium]
MKEQLRSLISELKSDRRLVSFDEAATKQVVLLRVLSLLGWNIYDINEVKTEYSTGGQTVDYALRHANTVKIFIEVEKVGDNLEEHREQLMNASFKEGVNLSVLTNGISWWFYSPIYESSWEQRKLCSVEIYDQEPEDIADRFIDCLGKENVFSGKAFQNATAIYESEQTERTMSDTLPLAWSDIASAHNEQLISLIADRTEEICGYKPDRLMVTKFMSSNLFQAQTSYATTKEQATITGKPLPGNPDNDTRKSVISLSFQNTRFEVVVWINVLIKVCSMIHSLSRNNSEWVLQIQGKKRPYLLSVLRN